MDVLQRKLSKRRVIDVFIVIEILSCACMSWIAGGLLNLKASMLAFAQKLHAALLCICLLWGSLGDLGPLFWSFLFGSHCNHIGSGEPEGGFQLCLS